MTTVYQVVYDTVSSAVSSGSDSDTTITLLTTIRTTTYEPISTTATASQSAEMMEPSIKTSTSSSTSSSTHASSTSSLKLAQTSLALTETITEPGSNTSGTKLGLAIGIPIAVISLFVLVALGWVFLRKKIRSKSTEYLTYDAEEAYGGKPTFERRKNLPTSTETTEKNPPRFLSRLSRMVNPEWISSLDLKSPVFMKSFNLKKEEPEEKQEENSSVPGYKSKRPPSLDLSKGSVSSVENVSSDSKLVVIKAYTKSQAGEISIVVGDLAVMNFHKGNEAHISLLNREGYGFVPMNCLRKY
ncbi:uncharacterized protein CXQ87_004017 [Candidozyma duobushaemuli]|uniref:SH3 domain-containing protein n=2 Tax=Candidozyma TaxID=3303203 RepID=A0ABX8I7B5_9ASCO|nr:uncharacterized protein CXQ87_004017 [[Candida] duobushaemulonis]PVH16152.1 hypothetical protein CXQ87_004017 [[Candida] duobushaemulonis]QWU89175.1 hypothetical protein CA3LBN_003498 [[Candida] haemuloni]